MASIPDFTAVILTTNIFELTKLFGLIVVFTFFSFLSILFDQNFIFRGIKNFTILEFSRKKENLLHILSIELGYAVITLYAFVIMLLIINPMIDAYSPLSGANLDYIPLIFILSSGIIVRFIYVFVSPSYGNVLWDFYAIPGIFLLFALFVSNAFTSGQPVTSLPIFQMLFLALIAVVLGFLGEIVIHYVREKKGYKIERHILRETLDMVPLCSEITIGRQELYQTLIRLLEIASIEPEPRSVVGISIFFESDEKEIYNRALKNFIDNSSEKSKGKIIRFLGPKEQIPGESDETYEKRLVNIKEREKLGVTIKHFPLNAESFRFFVVNHKYAAIIFPPIGTITSDKTLRSTVTVTCVSGIVASMLHTVFEDMWHEAIEIENKNANANRNSSPRPEIQ